ncbi:MAG: fumarylacetoacetase [Burkholderiales bacterium]|nr:fumarylacetoacetase [Burkholderiales bacterium]
MSSPAPNATHAAALRSWVKSANVPGAEFPIQNLPFAVFSPGTASPHHPRCGVGIGDQILDVGACADLMGDALARAAAYACRAASLNDLMKLGQPAASALRRRLSQLLASGSDDREAVAAALIPLSQVELHLPVRIGGFTDFYASVHHATNVGRLMRPDNPLLPNYKYVPIGYNGRANSVRVSGEPVRRPRGQAKGLSETAPVFGPSRRLDYEVELGLYIGAPSTRDEPIPVDGAWDHVFGFSLLNDWSARDIQSWEYQPLGPFLSKSFATTVSPWVVTAEALIPFRVPAAPRDAGDPRPLPHLFSGTDQESGGLAVMLDASLRTRRMAELGLPPKRLSRSNTASLYWTFGQMVAHHTSNGCALDSGDLLGSGTVSGEGEGAQGALLELTAGGSRALHLEATGEQRSFLEDGDEVIFGGRCEREGFVSIGFGQCQAAILAVDAEAENHAG